jgi:hypothetical protein
MLVWVRREKMYYLDKNKLLWLKVDVGAKVGLETRLFGKIRVSRSNGENARIVINVR